MNETYFNDSFFTTLSKSTGTLSEGRSDVLFASFCEVTSVTSQKVKLKLSEPTRSRICRAPQWLQKELLLSTHQLFWQGELALCLQTAAFPCKCLDLNWGRGDKFSGLPWNFQREPLLPAHQLFYKQFTVVLYTKPLSKNKQMQ